MYLSLIPDVNRPCLIVELMNTEPVGVSLNTCTNVNFLLFFLYRRVPCCYESSAVWEGTTGTCTCTVLCVECRNKSEPVCVVYIAAVTHSNLCKLVYG